MTLLRGIDVSQWQGEIDWEAVKSSGVEFAMLRAGYGQSGADSKFRRNAAECGRLGIPFGAYWFSYAYTEELARSEARRCIETLGDLELLFPVAFDFEYASADYAAKKGVAVDKGLATAMAEAFCSEIEGAGFTSCVYANPDYLNNRYEPGIAERHALWLAKWEKDPDPESRPYGAAIWQYSGEGTVAGIKGRVDLDLAYVDYPSLLRSKRDGEEEKARRWVIENGISDGERPEEYATRSEVWRMLYRALNN